MMQSRIRSKAAWTATFTLIIFILKTYFGVTIPKVDDFINLILAVLTVWGVWNNPTDSEGF